MTCRVAREMAKGEIEDEYKWRALKGVGSEFCHVPVPPVGMSRGLALPLCRGDVEWTQPMALT
jgi:hypothetical protein